ncbi:hypothetical protein B0H13DRAFT_1854684 [Mycena leptocephala]|nr:hypothetical protein B0H13DRAFT_1854684 [Mycena leptocephala]
MDTSMALMLRVPKSQMQLVRGSSSDPGPGRTLHQVYSRAGDYVGKQANRAARRWGQGPSAAAERITDFFGTGSEREIKLGELRGREFPWLEGECSKLLKYALPWVLFHFSKSRLQHNSMGRALFLKSKHLRARNTEMTISAMWARTDDMQPPDWDFRCELAAACLSEEEISGILGNIPAGCLGLPDTESGHLSAVERLLIELDRRTNITSEALARRYLGGILDLPAFWSRSGPIHARAFARILSYVICVLNDLGLVFNEDEDEDGVIFDFEGIDSMASAILVGVLGWSTLEPESEDWYHDEIVRLLRLPQAESILPTSLSLATGPGMRNLDPDTAPETFVILMIAEDDIDYPDHMSLQNIGSVLNDSVETLNLMSKIRWSTPGTALRVFGRRRSTEFPEPPPAKMRFGIKRWLRNLFRRPHFVPNKTSIPVGVVDSEDSPHRNADIHTTPAIHPLSIRARSVTSLNRAGPLDVGNAEDEPDRNDMHTTPIDQISIQTRSTASVPSAQPSIPSSVADSEPQTNIYTWATGQLSIPARSTTSVNHADEPSGPPTGGNPEYDGHRDASLTDMRTTPAIDQLSIPSGGQGGAGGKGGEKGGDGGLDCSVSPHLSSDICLGLDWKTSVREWLISLGERPTSGFESMYLKALDPAATVLHLCPQDTMLGSVTPSVTVNNTSSDPRATQVPQSGTTLPVPPRFAYAQTDFACARNNLSSAIDTVQNNTMFTIDHYNSMLRSTPNVPTHESASVNAPLQGPSSVRRVPGPVPFLPDVGLDTLFLSSDPLQNVLCSLVVL